MKKKQFVKRESALQNADDEGQAYAKQVRRKRPAVTDEATEEERPVRHRKTVKNMAEERIKTKRTVFVGNLPPSCTKKHDHKRSVFVGNLPYDVMEPPVREHFEDCGNVEASPDSVMLALKLNASKLLERNIRVKRSEEGKRTENSS